MGHTVRLVCTTQLGLCASHDWACMPHMVRLVCPIMLKLHMPQNKACVRHTVRLMCATLSGLPVAKLVLHRPVICLASLGCR